MNNTKPRRGWTQHPGQKYPKEFKEICNDIFSELGIGERKTP